jgi:hypothetical protein
MEKDTEAAWTDQIVLSSQQSPVEEKNINNFKRIHHQEKTRERLMWRSCLEKLQCFEGMMPIQR